MMESRGSVHLGSADLPQDSALGNTFTRCCEDLSDNPHALPHGEETGLENPPRYLRDPVPQRGGAVLWFYRTAAKMGIMAMPL